jgi:predicted ATP-grasp superfamily ATP-dependent carboligase
MYELRSRPELDGPVLVMAPEGWIDAGLGGAGAVGAMLVALDTQVVASFDVDRLLDHRSRRPISHMLDGVYTDLVWPSLDLLAAHDADGRAVLILAGPEPDHEWRAFADAIGELATMFGVRLAVGLGAFPAGVPHTRTSRLAATASNAELANQLGVVSGEVQVPAGIVAAIERKLNELDIPTIAVWARVPHYAAAMPYPAAAAALVQGLVDIGGLTLSSSDLDEAAERAKSQIDELIANSDEHRAMVNQLEAQVDATEGEQTGFDPSSLPSGDEIAAELERFLRGQG